MNRLEIKDISIIEDIDLNNFVPEGSFCLVFNVDIGMVDEIGADEFRFSVCNKDWLIKNLLQRTNYEFLNNYNMIVVETFSMEIVHKALDELLIEINEKMENQVWSKKAIKINQYLRWEYFNEFVMM